MFFTKEGNIEDGSSEYPINNPRKTEDFEYSSPIKIDERNGDGYNGFYGTQNIKHDLYKNMPLYTRFSRDNLESEINSHGVR